MRYLFVKKVNKNQKAIIKIHSVQYAVYNKRYKIQEHKIQKYKIQKAIYTVSMAYYFNRKNKSIHKIRNFQLKKKRN